MRTRIDVTYTAGTRSINTGYTSLTIDDIRFICNETQKVILCSSMQKDLIASISNGVITYVTSYIEVSDDGTETTVTIPPLASGDKITFEIDLANVSPTYSEISSADISAITQRVINQNSI